jgi:hypothetical protein
MLIKTPLNPALAPWLQDVNQTSISEKPAIPFEISKINLNLSLDYTRLLISYIFNYYFVSFTR